MASTADYEGMIAETVSITGHNGDPIHAYFARPEGPGPFPGMVLLHHMPGWDEWYKECTRRFAHHGYATICPDLYCRVGHGTPEEVAVQVRGQGGIPDDQVVGDVKASAAFLRGLPSSTGKVGGYGTCSGGRHAYLAACRGGGLDAVIDCWGGGVVMGEADLTPNRPVAPIDYTKDLPCPILGLFGDQDRSPTPDQVAQHEAALKQHDKDYEFHMYEGAGHGFMYYVYPQTYKADAAVDGWNKVWDFLDRKLGS